MKNMLLLIALLLCAPTISAQKRVDDLMADSAKLYVEYIDLIGYINDSTYTRSIKQRVFLGEKAAIYVHQSMTPEEFLKMRVEQSDPKFVTPEEEIKFTKERYDIEKMVSSVWITYYGAPDYLDMRKYNEGEVWSSDTINFKWTPVDSFKIIKGYKCQKATTKNIKGQEIIVWFTEEIPISSGPTFLTGLPGLILEFYNPQGKRFTRVTTITSTNIPRQFFRRWLKGPVVTKEEDWELYRGATEKARQFLKMLKSDKHSN